MTNEIAKCVIKLKAIHTLDITYIFIQGKILDNIWTKNTNTFPFVSLTFLLLLYILQQRQKIRK